MAVFHSWRGVVPWAVTLVLFIAGAGAEGQQPAEDTAVLSAAERLALFRKETPAARLRLVEKLPGAQGEFHKVTVGPLAVTRSERGVVEAAVISEIVCRLKAMGKYTTVATTIKWVIDEGTFVKQGDRVLELDDSGLREQLAAQKVVCQKADAAKIRAEEDFRLLRKANQVEIRLSEIALRVAELERKQATGADKDRQEILDLRVEQARLELERTKAQSRAREKQADAGLQAVSAQARQEAEQRSDLEEQLKLCVLRAPRDGIVVYFVPEQARIGGTQQPIVAQGEPVREGQKLLQIPDLKNLLVNVKVHEAFVSRVKVGQPVTIRVDAFPNRVLHGKVASVATGAAQQDWLSADVKVYTTKVAIDPADSEGLNLKPGMSAEVRFVVEERPGVVQVPVQAVVLPQRARFVFVKTPAGIEERPVTTGISNNLVVEIKEGLKEGDLVLRQPEAVLRRLDLRPTKGDIPPREGRKGGQLQATEILLRSIKPPVDKEGVRRPLVESYGVTEADLERLGNVPGVTTMLPMRVFPSEVDRLEKKVAGRVVATTPAFATVAGMKLTVGRFLREDDSKELRNVAVLGSALAAELFPFEDPVGKTVVLGKHSYEVVGVLDEQTQGFAGLDAGSLNQAVFLPLPTCQVRFGERIIFREAGARKIEAVAISAVVVQVADVQQVRAVAAAMRAQLEAAHPRKDWEMQTPEGR